MPAQYNSFLIKNTTSFSMIISIKDADGNIFKVGTLSPGKESIQHAPVGVTWVTSVANPATQELVQPDEDTSVPIPSKVPQTISSIVDKSIDSGMASPSNSEFVVAKKTPQAKDVEPTIYEAFLKLETGTHTARIDQLLVTPDNKTLITSGKDKTIRVWNIENKKPERLLLGQIGIGENGKIQRIALSPDGKYVVALVWLYPEQTHEAYDRETDVRVYELATGNLQSRFRYRDSIADLDISPDGKYLAMVGNPKNHGNRRGQLELYDFNSLLEGFGTGPLSLASAVFYEYDAILPANVRFIPDGQAKSAGYRIVVAAWYEHKFQSPEHTSGLLWYSFSPASGLKTVLSCELEQDAMHDALAVSSDFVVVTVHGDSNQFHCYDHNGKLITTVLSESIPAAPAFSQNGNQLIVGQRKDSAIIQVKVYDTAFGQFQLKSAYFGHDSAVVAVAVLQDGTAISAGGDQNAIHFWNPTHIEGEKIAEINGVGRVVHAVGMNPNEQIGIGNRDDLRRANRDIVLQRVFDLRAMTLKALSMDDSAGFRRAKKRSGKLRLKWKEQWGNINLFLLPNEEPLTGISDPNQPDSFIWYYPETFGFTEKGTIVTGAGDGKVRVASPTADGYYPPPLRLLLGHTASLRDHAACGRWLVTAGADQTIRLWYLEDVEQDVMTDLEPALNLFIGSDDEWVIWSQSGYYAASQNGDRYLGYHINRGLNKEALFFPSDRFKAFLRPDVIKAIVEHGSEDRARAQGVAIPKIDVSQILPPTVELVENGVQISATKTEEFITFSVNVETHGEPFTRLWVLRNGRLVNEQKTLPPDPITVPLLPGENRFKIFVENQNAKSNPIEHTVTGKGRLDEFVGSNGALYVLAIGVSNLKKPSPENGFNNLNYGHADATSIYNAFGREVDSDTLEGFALPFINEAFEEVDRTLLVNDQASLSRIDEELDNICARIKDKFEERVKNREPAKRDVLLVFLSGHGIYRSRNRQLYFGNYDFDYDNIDNTGLSFVALGEKITSLPAEVILMTDACHSGMAGGDVVKGIDPNELAKRIYGINETEMYIFNAARSSELAREDPSADHPTVSHGYFTKSILDALLDEKNPKVSMLGLMDQVQWGIQKYTNLHTPVCRMYGDLLPLVIYEKKYPSSK